MFKSVEKNQISLLLSVFDLVSKSWGISPTEVSNILYRYGLYDYIAENYEFFNELSLPSVVSEVEDVLGLSGWQRQQYLSG